MNTSDFKLCFIEGNHAYFTTKNLKEQFGWWWDEIPYTNAEKPYSYNPIINNGELPWYIQDIYFQSDLKLPDEIYSVEQINSGIVPWLKKDAQEIYAGMSLDTFIMFMHTYGKISFSKRFS